MDYSLTCGNILMKAINAKLIVQLELWNSSGIMERVYSSMFCYTKSNAKPDKMEMQEFWIPVNCIC